MSKLITLCCLVAVLLNSVFAQDGVNEKDKNVKKRSFGGGFREEKIQEFDEVREGFGGGFGGGEVFSEKFEETEVEGGVGFGGRPGHRGGRFDEFRRREHDLN